MLLTCFGGTLCRLFHPVSLFVVTLSTAVFCSVGSSDADSEVTVTAVDSYSDIEPLTDDELSPVVKRAV